MNTLQKPKRLEDEEVLKLRRSQPCWACGAPPPGDPSHVKTRGSGGPDTDWNVVPLCRIHHTEWGTSAIKFIRKYPMFGRRIYDLGWYVTSGKLWNDRLNRV